MSEAVVQERTLQELCEAFLIAMPPDGTSIGNMALRNSLAWDEEKYSAIRTELLSRGILALGQGRGGSVRRADRDPESVADQKLRLLDELPLDGAGIASRVVREKLGWFEEQYEFIKNSLLEEGRIRPRRGGGLGGSIGRPPNGGSLEPAEDEERPRARELSIYPDFEKGLRGWAQRQGWTAHEVEVIANQGRRATGGTWTRPDCVVIGYKTYEYTFGKIRDIETFEVKMSDCPIDAVFETAAHSRFATRSYLAVHRSGGLPTSSDLARIESECQRFGLGLILFADPKDMDAWEFRVAAIRREPDPANLEDFIRLQLSQASQQKLRQWLH